MKNRNLVLAAGIVTASTALLAAAYLLRSDEHRGHEHPHGTLAALERTVLPAEAGEPLTVAGFLDADGKPVEATKLRGRWSILFFGYTSCPDVCPTTLATLAAVARDPASGVADRSVQIVFVSVDPERDSPQRLKPYLEGFDPRFVGLTGSREALQRLASQVGAGYRESGAGLDHSTSLFVVDPESRTAAVLLHPSDPARIVADLDSVRHPGS